MTTESALNVVHHSERLKQLIRELEDIRELTYEIRDGLLAACENGKLCEWERRYAEKRFGTDVPERVADYQGPLHEAEARAKFAKGQLSYFFESYGHCLK